MLKAREWPRGLQMPGPWAAQNLQMPHPRTDEAGKCTAVARGRERGGGGAMAGRSWNWLMHNLFNTAAAVVMLAHSDRVVYLTKILNVW